MYRETALEGNELPYVVNTANYSLIIYFLLTLPVLWFRLFQDDKTKQGLLEFSQR